MAHLSKFGQTGQWDTTNTAGQGASETPISFAGNFTPFVIPTSPSNKTPHGYGSIRRLVYRFAQTGTVDTTTPGDVTGPNNWTDDYLNS